MIANTPRRPTVLVIDDDDDIRTTIQDVLEDQGFIVASAANGRVAMEMLQRAPSMPALILLDLMMPEMDGYAFRREQRKVPRLADIPVVLFSGNLDGGQAALDLDVSATMNKPLGLGDLVTLVEELARCRKPN